MNSPLAALSQTLELNYKGELVVVSNLPENEFKLKAEMLGFGKEKFPNGHQLYDRIQDLTKEAKVPLFPCPPPDDPLQIPADIGDRMIHTVNFLYKKLSKSKRDIDKSLSECPTSGFKDMCSPDQEALKQKKEEEESAKSCISSADISTEDKDAILKARLASINTGISGTIYILDGPLTKTISFTEGLALVRNMTAELKETKAKAESGQIQNSCAK
jgi:hypothetical protein